mmetsp:Transcript_12052/g.15781  ORF Transcript_12052/g.15781 Transcript_12052/m.15781 type:complete len:128 (+) Transcript_12052:103-486(+)|eukprot:CAMPEP_0198137860 /NCGR_PEP_ID=MMETSP1443-20131203/1312_1 /TAXON_ID=186043 /ORGANISM="Entomoneis sp., Strain CCMP2396" /LENGTH=127 /DNA_ID=CAMNT_0043799423 /DNA_START=31 /DNA_END=414 /DNA_ORIENTATION=+
MVKTKVIQQSSIPSHCALAVKILFVLIILLLLPELVQSFSRNSRKRNRGRLELKALLKECEQKGDCPGVPEENVNCFYDCLSPSCYDEIYGDNPLEPGEIDFDRYQKFEKCLKDERTQLKKERRKQK